MALWDHADIGGALKKVTRSRPRHSLGRPVRQMAPKAWYGFGLDGLWASMRLELWPVRPALPCIFLATGGGHGGGGARVSQQKPDLKIVIQDQYALRTVSQP